MATLPQINIKIPQRLDIPRPADIGPSVFPGAVDQLKLIQYSAVPAGGQLEKDLHNYYSYMARVAANTATEQDLISLKALMVRVREYIVTEDDFNLMADAVRTTQEYMLNAISEESKNFTSIAEVSRQLAENLNNWSETFQLELAKVQSKGTSGSPVVYSTQHPGSSALGYLWINRELGENYIAPTLSFDPENPIFQGNTLDNS